MCLNGGMSADDVRHIEAFLEAAAAEKGRAGNTLEAYRRDLAEFHRLTPGATATARDVSAYMETLAKRHLAGSTQARRLAALRAYFRFLLLEGVREDDPTAGVEQPQRQAALPRYLTEEEIKNLFAHTQTIAERAGLEILYCTGMRISEMLELGASAIPTGAESMTVKGKGAKSRIVPLSGSVHAAVRELRAAAPAGAKYLFSDRSGRGHIPRQSFCRTLKRIATRAGIHPSRVSPHVLRHSFATHLLQNGANIRVIQMLLGHEDIHTTEVYTHLQPEHLNRAVQAHPLAK